MRFRLEKRPQQRNFGMTEPSIWRNVAAYGDWTTPLRRLRMNGGKLGSDWDRRLYQERDFYQATPEPSLPSSLKNHFPAERTDLDVL